MNDTSFSQPPADNVEPMSSSSVKQVRRLRGFKANDGEWTRWQGAASAVGRSFSSWARELLEAAALGRTGGVKPPQDQEFAAALLDLQIAYGISDSAQVVRMSILAAQRRLHAGQDAFLLLAPATRTDESEIRPRARRSASPKSEARTKANGRGKVKARVKVPTKPSRPKR